MRTASLSTETSEAGLNFFLGMHQYVWVEVARRDSLLYYYVRSKAKILSTPLYGMEILSVRLDAPVLYVKSLFWKKIFWTEKINCLHFFFFFGFSNVRIIYWENKIQNSLTPNLPWLWPNFLLGQWYHLAGLSFTKLIKLVIIVDNLPPPSPSEHLTDVTRKTYYDWLTETGSSPNKGRLVA